LRTGLHKNERLGVTKRVIIRLISGGQPVTGAIEAYNAYELIVQTTKGRLAVFKHGIATIEIADEPKGLQADRGGFKADDKTFSAR
jgi:sRNA-binding regulator protein Hfq